MYYLIDEVLKACTASECHEGKKQYVAVLTPEEWQKEKEAFELGIDMELDAMEVHTTKAEINYDSITGTFAIPDRKNMRSLHSHSMKKELFSSIRTITSLN